MNEITAPTFVIPIDAVKNGDAVLGWILEVIYQEVIDSDGMFWTNLIEEDEYGQPIIPRSWILHSIKEPPCERIDLQGKVKDYAREGYLCETKIEGMNMIGINHEKLVEEFGQWKKS